MTYRLGELSERFDLPLRGDAQRQISGVCSLAAGAADRLSYLSDTQYLPALAKTAAGAVICTEQVAESCPTAVLISARPKLAYIRVAELFLPPPPDPGIHPDASVSDRARVDSSASIAARAVVQGGAVIGAGAVLESGCVIGENAVIGAGTRIGANASIAHGVSIGERAEIGPCAVIGARGFGLEHDGKAWQAIPQLGSVRVGDDVEIGAGSTIDRGAIEDTEIGEGVKIDDQVHIAHNCRIGAHTVIAGCTGIAGSCTIGSMCVIGGGVGIGDHVAITDNVMITGATQVPKSISQPGVYSSTLRAMPAGDWRKRLAVFNRLERIQDGLRSLQRRFKD